MEVQRRKKYCRKWNWVNSWNELDEHRRRSKRESHFIETRILSSRIWRRLSSVLASRNANHYVYLIYWRLKSRKDWFHNASTTNQRIPSAKERTTTILQERQKFKIGNRSRQGCWRCIVFLKTRSTPERCTQVHDKPTDKSWKAMSKWLGSNLKPRTSVSSMTWKPDKKSTADALTKSDSPMKKPLLIMLFESMIPLDYTVAKSWNSDASKGVVTGCLWLEMPHFLNPIVIQELWIPRFYRWNRGLGHNWI